MKQKYYLVLNDQEHRLIIESLNQLRNKLIADGKYTDAVDEVLLKIISAKQKKFKVIFKGGVIMEKTFMTKETVFGTNFKTTTIYLA